MKRMITTLHMLGLLATLAGGCVSVRHVTGGMGIDELKANGNTSAAIQAEIQSEEFVALLARRTGLPEWRVRMSLPVVEFSDYGSMSYSTHTRPDLLEPTQRYIGMRRAGHTKTYSMARLETEPDERTLPSDCRTILREDKDVYLPWLWLHSFKVETGTNYTSYVILDGDLAWSYVVSRRNDQALVGCYADWFDAKEFLPQYRQAFEEVHRLVQKEMKAQGNWDQFGSCHSYWARKKELLKKQGIDWKSPPDLHPNTCYD